MTYRADIDGLRAIAVTIVVLYHAGATSISGGYVGVDVFFVVSGFLISGIIWRDLDAGEFSFLSFYERRIRRIYPALFFMILVSLGLASFFLVPDDFLAMANSAASTAVYGSNVFFWRKSGYFDTPAELAPLLHTWSLAVEEQFYVVYPVFLAVVHRIARARAVHVLTAVLISSLALATWAINTYPEASFYLLPTRAWELALGSLLAVASPPATRARAASEAAGVAGLLLIGYAAFAFDSSTPIPGPMTLVPCLGAALILYAGRGPTLVGRLLETRPLVFVGQISYSLYLWHWPALTLSKHLLAVRELPPWATLSAVVGSVALAWVSFQFVEQPVRRRGWLSTKAIFAGGAVAMVLTGGVGLTIAAAEGFPGRFSEPVRVILQAGIPRDRVEPTCFPTAAAVRAGRFCEVGAPSAQPSFLLWGDSHARYFRSMIGGAAAASARTGVSTTQSSCPPLLGIVQLDREGAELCSEFNDAVAERVRATPKWSTVILAARWAYWAEGTRYGQEPGKPVRLAHREAAAPSGRGNRAEVRDGLRRTLAAISSPGRRVVIIGPVPEVGRSVPKALAMSLITGRVDPLEPAYSDYLRRQEFVLPMLEELAREFGAELVLPHRALCERDRCAVVQAGIPLYVDSHHLSPSAEPLLHAGLMHALRK